MSCLLEGKTERYGDVRVRRGIGQKVLDCVTFPLRALCLFEDDKWMLSSLRTERFDYVAREVRGYCLDVGCGRHNLFVARVLAGRGKGIDVYSYEGLDEDNIVKDITHFPFPDSSFTSVTFIANINHVPEKDRDIELAEAYRCLEPGGNIVITMGNPIAEILVHRVVACYDWLFGTRHDMDAERGMNEDEEYYLRDSEILEHLYRAGFRDIMKKYFATQWGLNHLFVGLKPADGHAHLSK